MHKDGISLSGLAEKNMFKFSKENEYEEKYTIKVIENEYGEYGEITKKKIDDNKFYLIDDQNKECFYKLRNNNVGGPSIVFNRYHEADKKTISHVKHVKNGEYEIIPNGKVVKKIVGFDANALYLWSLSQYMPTGFLSYENLEDKKINVNELLDNTFGFYEVDIKVPEHLYDEFSEFPPIFKNVTLTETKERKLISCLEVKKILLYHPLLKWYIDHGLVVEKIYGYIKSKECKTFNNFGDKVSDERRKGDDKSKPELKIIGDEMKNIGNSAFGRTAMNKSKHTKTIYKDLKQYKHSVNSPYFRDAEEFDNFFEIEMRKKTTYQNMPLQISSAIFQYTKLRMLQFYYDFLVKFVDRSDFQMLYMETDSMYMAITAEKFDEIIKPDMKLEYEKEKLKWFPQNLYETRTPGLFKVEYEGEAMICLCSKLYYCRGNEKDKFSNKGSQYKNNVDVIVFENYKTCLMNDVKMTVNNSGMRYLNGSIYWYSQTKVGLNPKYNKRNIMSDRVTTYPLISSQYE